MSSSVEHYKVFLSSPGGLEDERKVFYNTVDEYSKNESIPRDVGFEPLGYERVPSEYGDPQDTINEKCLVRCDYFILMIWDRVGSPCSQNPNMSRTESEYRLAEDLKKKGSMRNIAVFYKKIDDQKARGSEDELQCESAKKLRQKLMDENTVLIKHFDNITEFGGLIRQHLGEWLREHVREHEERRRPTPKLDTVMDIGKENTAAF